MLMVPLALPRLIIMRVYLSPTRYYVVAVQRDLFGSCVLVRTWGGRGSRRGGTATEPYSHERLIEIDKARRAHGYSLS